MFERINDLLALLLLIIVIPGLWIAQARGLVQLPGEVTGAAIAGWTLVLQHYFRKAPPAAPPSPPRSGGPPIV